MTDAEKADLLESIKQTILSEEYVRRLRERVKRENDEYENIIKAQQLSFDDMHRQFNI